MSTVTVGSPTGSDPKIYPCIVGSNTITVVVTVPTIQEIGDPDLPTYIQARALLASGDSSGTTSFVTPYANGSTDNPNWAQQWLDGNIPF